MILLLHILFAGIWLGCVLTEIFFERALLGKGRDYEVILANLHKMVDLFIELPVLMIVAITGVLQLKYSILGLWQHLMIGAGAIAIIANVYCVYLVLTRAKAANNSDWLEFEKLDHFQHKAGAIVLCGIIIAIICGIIGRL
jgi:hypothetical protein